MKYFFSSHFSSVMFPNRHVRLDLLMYVPCSILYITITSKDHATVASLVLRQDGFFC